MVIATSNCESIVTYDTISSGITAHGASSTTTAQTEVECGMKLKEARIRTGLGRRRASKHIGVGISQLYRYEAGLLRPGIEVVMRISRALDLDPWQIDEFRPTLEKAATLGLAARPSEANTEGRS